MSLTSEINAVIFERVEKGNTPREYMNLPHGFRFGSTHGHGLTLSHPDHPDTTVKLGTIERGRWCLDLGWRDRVREMVNGLALDVVTTYTEEVPF